jgi:nickel-dependent lactate racemase
MSEAVLEIPWGASKLGLHLPPEWDLLGVMEPASGTPPVEAGEAAARALAAPIGLPRLSQMVSSGMRIALVIDDESRPTPIARLLPPLLQELRRGGVQESQITLVLALGVHEPMSAAAVARRVGPDVIASLRWENHDCDSREGLVFLGTTRRGTSVLINRTVAQADLVILVGCIEPHIIAGFGGGTKNLVPGVAGRTTIAHNHSLNCRPDTFNSVGQPLEANPMRMDLEEAASMVQAPVVILNAVLNSALQVVQVVCGHPQQAHRQGMQTSARIYGAAVPALADVVITSSHPMDSDLRQGVKALANTIRALKPGGVIITLIRAESGVGVFGLANRRLPVGQRALRVLAPLLLPLVPRLPLAGMGEEDRFFLYFALQAMRRGDLLVYAPTIPAATQGNLPFVTFVSSLEAGLERAQTRFPNRASLLVFPHGGSTFPILPA